MLLSTLFSMLIAIAAAQTSPQVAAQSFNITNKSGNKIDFRDLNFTDSTGEAKDFSRFFGDKPVVVSLVYYSCPDICGLVLNGMLDGFNDINFTPGRDFEVVSLSINPKEGPGLAKLKRENVLANLRVNKPDAEWSFLTGEESEISKIADQLGFSYKFIPGTGEYAHAPGIFVLDSNGNISASLATVIYSKEVLEHTLIQASNGKLGTAIQRFSSFWRKHDFQKQEVILNTNKILILLAAFIVFSFLIFLLLRTKSGAKIG